MLLRRKKLLGSTWGLVSDQMSARTIIIRVLVYPGDAKQTSGSKAAVRNTGTRARRSTCVKSACELG